MKPLSAEALARGPSRVLDGPYRFSHSNELSIPPFLFSLSLQTLEALSLGSSTLRTILASPTLQISNIEATTSALDETLVAATEINEAVDSVAPLDSALEFEVDDELKALQAEDQRRQDTRVEDGARLREVDAQREKALLEAKVPEGQPDKAHDTKEAGDRLKEMAV